MLSQREAFARLMEHMCKHDGDGGHGYSQYARMGNGTTETVDLGDGVTVKVAGGDRDCSSGIITCLQAVGIDTFGATYTGNMKSQLLRTGLFTWHPMGDGYIAQRGDIYLNESHHTAMCTSAVPDMLAQFSISELGKVYGKVGDQTGRESNIRSYYSYPWHGKLAWKNDGAMIGVKPLPAALQGYTDLDSNAWYIEALDKAVLNNWLHGYGNGHLGPNDALTRAQACVILSNFTGETYVNAFSDVTADNWYYNAVTWAKNKGIVSGYGDGSFGTFDPCSREAFATMIYNLRGKPGHVGQPTGMSDWGNVSDWARDAVAWAVERGIIGSTGRIRPQDACTRAEAAAMIGRA